MKILITQQRKLWWLISSSLIGVSLVAMGISWLNFGTPLRLGLDFVGGTRLQFERACDQGVDCSQPLSPGAIRTVVSDAGFSESGIQILGDAKQGFSLRTPSLEVTQRSELQAKLAEAFGPFDPEQTQIDSVGPVIGKRLLASGLLALVLAFAGIIIYLAIRFKLDYALLAILALFHDVMITSGFFSLLGLFQGAEVNTLFLVGLLTIAGFSVNDTVVIYDRIRETSKYNPDLPIATIIDDAVNQTLGRSINTTLTTLLPLTAILLLGGATLKSFVLTLIIGFILGSYSSIFVASSLLGWWRELQESDKSNSMPSTVETTESSES